MKNGVYNNAYYIIINLKSMVSETQKAIWKIQTLIKKQSNKGHNKDKKEYKKLQAELRRMVEVLRDERENIKQPPSQEPKVETPVEEPVEIEEKPKNIKSSLKEKIGLTLTNSKNTPNQD